MMEKLCPEEPDFQASPLGTKEFWENSFKRDLHVYMERKEIDDIWFGQESVDRVLKWLRDNEIIKSSSIIDIGCGNGATLLALASEGYTDLCGVDYAASAIALATTVCANDHKKINFQECDFLKDLSDLKLSPLDVDSTNAINTPDTISLSDENIKDTLKTDKSNDYGAELELVKGQNSLENTKIPVNTTKNNVDYYTTTDKTTKTPNDTTTKTTNNTNEYTTINSTTNTTINSTTNTTNNTTINTNPTQVTLNLLESQYDVCLDKGTYDAICLNPNNRSENMLSYQYKVSKICKDGGLFVLTSCNWTRDELMKFFSSDFELVHQIPTRTFQFGGVQGNVETVLVLKKVKKDC